MEIKRKVTCPSCKRDCAIIVGDAGQIGPQKCPGCGTDISADKILRQTTRDTKK